jgi:hypothetical protein
MARAVDRRTGDLGDVAAARIGQLIASSRIRRLD